MGLHNGRGWLRLVGRGTRWQHGLGLGLMALGAVAVACGTDTPQPSVAEKTGEQRQAIDTAPYEFQVALPMGVQHALLSASNRLTLNGQGSIGKVGTLSHLAGFGSSSTTIQAAAKVYGHLLSGGTIYLGSGATIFGSAQSGGTINPQDATAKVLGTQSPNTPAVPQLLKFSVDWPTTAGAPVMRNAGNSLPAAGNPGEELAPGNYGAFNVGDRNRLTFRAGSYFFTSFELATQAEVRIDSTLGPVAIYVRDTVRIFGRLLPAQNSSGVAIVPEGQVLLGFRGTGQVQLSGGFIGNVVAPNAEILLPAPSNGGQHKGSFYGRDVTVDSNSNLPIIPLDINITDLLDDPHTPPDSDVPDPVVDTDGDGVRNSEDECPADPLKTKRGLCDCGVSDVDSDNDKVPDCLEDLDDNPGGQVTGVCSTLSVGAPCTSFRCGGEPATCQANGECGNAAAECNPGSGPGGGGAGTCFDLDRGDSSYWFCTHNVTWSKAAELCGLVPGRNLARADDVLENNWLSAVANFPAWTSTNRVGSDWFAAWGSDKDATPLWFGGASGSKAPGAYTAWAAGQPTGGDCGYLADNGTWVATGCTTTRGFVCEMPIGAGDGTDDDDDGDDPSPGGVAPCVDSPPLGNFPTDKDVFKQDVEKCRSCEVEPCAAGVCEGVLSVPPVDSICPPDEFEKPDRCELDSDWVANNQPLTPCDRNAPACPANQICGRVETCPPGEECRNSWVCAPPDPLCGALFVDDKPRCDQVTLCNPDLETASVTEDELREENGSNLTPKTLDPAALFPAPTPLPTTDKVPGAKPDDCGTADEDDAACHLGVGHPWCKADAKPPQTNVPGANKAIDPLADRQGKTGSDKVVSFDFDPNMTLDYKVNPGLYGDLDMHLEASVSLGAKVGFKDLLGITKTFDILDAYAGATLDRCSTGADARLILLGHDFLPDILTEPQREQLSQLKRDSAFEADCNKAADDYLVELNKAQKAYRDAQEIVRQYKKGIDEGKRFGQDFCGQLIQTRTPEGFGPIDCTTAAPHQVVNAFISYAHKLLEELIAKSPFLSQDDLRLAGRFQFPGTEATQSKNIANYPFQIGPVPMNLSVDVFYGYGLSGNLGYEFTPAKALGVLRDLDPHQIARAYANVTPYALGGVELFLGVGFDFGPVAAKLGISGNVVLGEVRIPAEASAFIEVQAAKEDRELDAELTDMVDDAKALVFPPNGASSFAFRSGFQVQAEAKVDNILQGSLFAKLKIKFFFFSKTWQKQIVAFTGLGGLTFPIIDRTAPLKGELGVARMPVVFPRLRKVPQAPDPDAGGTGAGGAGGAPSEPEDFVFDNGRVETLFYNELCVPPVVEECPQIFATDGVYAPQIEQQNTPVAYGSTGMDLHDRVQLLSAQPGVPLGNLAAPAGQIRLRNDVKLGFGFGGDSYDIWHRVSYTRLASNHTFPFFVKVPPIVLTAPAYPPSFTQAGTISIYDGQTKSVKAGSYFDKVVVYSGGTLVLNGEALSPGTPQEFFFNQLQVEPGGKVVVNHGEGAVEVVIRDFFGWKGEIVNGTGRANAHVFGYYGTQSVLLQSLLGFKGTVVTPNAMLELNSRIYEGAFYGKFLEVHQDAQLKFSPCRGF